MEIVNFFESLAGKWFSQRTTHYLATQSSQAGQSNLLIEFLPSTEASLRQTWDQMGQDSGQILCGLKVNQDSRLEGETQSIQSSVVMIFLTPNGAGQGRFWQTAAAVPVLQGDYLLDQAILTLNSQTDSNRLEERLWFANPNLRMRTSVLKVGEAVQMASFCSEIRLGLVQPAA